MWYLFSIPSYPTDTRPIQIRDKIIGRHKKADKYHKKISTLTLFACIRVSVRVAWDAYSTYAKPY